MSSTSIPIELRMIAYRKSAKDGIIVSFAVHPTDVHDNLAAAAIGTRFMAAIVEIGDDEQPVVRKEPKHDRLVQRAGILCNEVGFQNYLKANWPLFWEESNGNPAKVVHEICEIQSRSELATNQQAADKFEHVLGKYEAWRRGIE